MLKDMRTVFDEEHVHLLYTIRNQSFSSLNSIRLTFSQGLKRDLEAFENWKKEYAPLFKFEPPWTFPDYYFPSGKNGEEKNVHLFAGYGVPLRTTEPTSIIAFTLLYVI
jgi:hypothetical protein